MRQIFIEIWGKSAKIALNETIISSYKAFHKPITKFFTIHNYVFITAYKPALQWFVEYDLILTK